MSWVDSLDDARSITAVFGQAAVLSGSVNVHEFVVHRDGPQVRLRFDLDDFPTDPPRKWLIDGFNTVQVDLCLVDVVEFSINGVARLMRSHIEISRLDGLIVTRLQSGDVSLLARSRFAAIVGLRPYVDSERVKRRC